MEREEFDLNCLNILLSSMFKLTKDTDKFLFENLSKINHKYVGYKIKERIPYINKDYTDYFIKSTIVYDFIGFDSLSERKYWLNEGYHIIRKSNLDILGGWI